MQADPRDAQIAALELSNKHRGERIVVLKAEIAALREALRDLLACYEHQIEERYCVCGSNDAKTHSFACTVQMRAQDNATAALAAVPAAKQEPQCRFCSSEMQPGKVHDCPKRQDAKQEVGE